MRSMTGYGRGVVERGELRATVDVRSVNHRFLDLKLRPGPLGAAEDAIAARVRGAIERGSVTVSVHLTGATAAVRIDADAAAQAHRALAELAAKLGMPGPELALVLAQPGVVVSGEPAGADDGTGASAALAALDAALAQLCAMRNSEGAALAAELRLRLDELVAIRARIAVLAATAPQHAARRLRERVQRLLDEAATGIASGVPPGVTPGVTPGVPPGVPIDEVRLAQEIAVLADRSDVTEELVRLASHLDQARALLDGPGAAGRRLEFLVQEIGRELNTVGAKSTSAEITTAIVDGKATLEKIREQVQNVE